MTRMTHHEISEQWHEAARSDKVDHNKGRERAFNQCRQYLVFIVESIEPERARYLYIAQRLADHFWAHNVAHRTKLTPGYPGHHGCRVRYLKRSLEMYWYYNSFSRKKNGTGHAVFSEHIRKEGKHGYYKSAFNRAQDWEKPVIAEVEAGFEMVRKLNANMVQVRRLLRANERLLANLETHLNSLNAPEL